MFKYCHEFLLLSSQVYISVYQLRKQLVNYSHFDLVETGTTLETRMATFSPSPAPRRSTRIRPPANSPPRRIRVTGNSRTASRLATPAIVTGDHGSVLSGMDVDEGSSVYTERASGRTSGEVTFARSDELTVSSYANLPVELRQVLKNAGMYSLTFSRRVQ